MLRVSLADCLKGYTAAALQPCGGSPIQRQQQHISGMHAARSHKDLVLVFYILSTSSIYGERIVNVHYAVSVWKCVLHTSAVG